jgi:hypothetical protein
MGTVNGESEKQGGIQRKWTNPIISRYVKYEGEKKIANASKKRKHDR